jgi:exopolysaccharide biosynthesis polyprenyl glycosylphosphotransferase
MRYSLFMKQSELFFSFLLVPLDFLMIILAGISAYYLRFASLATEIRPVIFSLPFGDYFQILLLIAFAWLIIFALAGLYSIKASRRLTAEVYRVILACSTGLMLIVIMIFAFRELFSSRFIVLAGWLLAIVYISFARIIIRLVQRILLRYGIGVHKIVLVGDSNTADALIHEFSGRKNSGYEVVKRLKNFSLEAGEDLAEFLKAGEVDEIIQSDPNLSKAEAIRLFDFADENHIIFKYAADLLGAKVLKTEVSEIAGIPVVEVKKTPLEGWGRIIKRIFDIILSLLFIVIFSPVFIITAVIIKLDSRGPVIYKNERVIKNGTFKLFKFRSMIYHYCVGEDYGNDQALELEKKLIEEKSIKTGPVYKIADDPRLTGAGKFIRRWSIDELPQFFNVLRGDMSLVGPRPHQPREVAKYERHHKKVLSIKPGITGLAQISGRSDLSFEDEVKLDIYYIENWSLLFDIAIMLRTPLAVIRGRKVE